MGKYVANEVIKHMIRKNLRVLNSKVLILGFSFKEDCPDVRNTRVIDIYNELKSFEIDVEVYDPCILPEEVMQEYGIDLLKSQPLLDQYSAVILAVAHKEFRVLNLKTSVNNVIFDVKGILERGCVDGRL